MVMVDREMSIAGWLLYRARSLLKATMLNFMRSLDHYAAPAEPSEEEPRSRRVRLLCGTDKTVFCGGEAFEARCGRWTTISTARGYSVLLIWRVSDLKSRDVWRRLAMAYLACVNFSAVLGLLEQEPEAFTAQAAR